MKPGVHFCPVNCLTTPHSQSHLLLLAAGPSARGMVIILRARGQLGQHRCVNFVPRVFLALKMAAREDQWQTADQVTLK